MKGKNDLLFRRFCTNLYSPQAILKMAARPMSTDATIVMMSVLSSPASRFEKKKSWICRKGGGGALNDEFGDVRSGEWTAAILEKFPEQMERSRGLTHSNPTPSTTHSDSEAVELHDKPMDGSAQLSVSQHSPADPGD